MCYAVPIVL